MRQTLIRIRLDSYFSLEPIDGITAIGIGWLALVVVPLFGWWLARNWRAISVERDPDSSLTAGIGGAVSLAMLAAPFVAGVDQFLPVYGYGSMLFVGFLTAAWWAGSRSRAVGLQTEVVWDSCMWLFFGGILGARIFYLVQKREQVFADANSAQDYVLKIVNLPDGGLVLYGGIILGSIFYAVHCHRRRLDGLLVGDVLIPSFFVGLGFGRLGCFMNGCCYGDACRLPWGVEFPHGSVPFEALVQRGFLPEAAIASMPLHPTQLYSALNAFLLAALYHAYFRYRPRNGSVIALALMTYPVTRFLLERLRADELGQFGTVLTISQWTSIGLFCGGVAFQVWLVMRDQPSSEMAPTT